MKKALSLILVLVMLIGMMPMQVFATEGTQEIEAVEVVTEPTEAPEEETTSPAEETEPSEPSEPVEEPKVIHEHDYEATVTDPTCTAQGFTTYTCNCGDSYVDNYTDTTGHSYASGVCPSCGSTISPYLQQLPENITGCSNLYSILKPVKGYYTAAKYDTGNGAVLSVVIPVEPGDRIAASSFGPVSQNMGSVNGIRVTYLLGDKIATSLSAEDVYNGYMKNGYITVPEGVDGVCIPWWKPSDSNWLTLAQASKNYAAHNPQTIPAQAATCTKSGYTEGEKCTICGLLVEGCQEIPLADHNYENNTCTNCGARNDVSPYLQTLPDNFLSCENLYTKLTPKQGYYTATEYLKEYLSVWSVVIPVEPGDRIAASSFGPVSQNMGSVNGIRVTYLLGDKIATSLSAGDVYNGFMKNGYITVPEGVDAVCIPWWKPSDSNWLTLAQASKNYAAHSPKQAPALEPTCTENGYTAGEVCEYCDASLGERKEIPATGHNYDGDTCTICGTVNVLAMLDGKYVSVLGDSISTFNGYSNDAAVNTTIGGNGPRYDSGTADTKPGSYCLLESVNDTWWMHFANRTGMKLLVNNSWAGSQVFGGQTSDGRQIPPAYLDRCVNLHDNTVSNNPGNAPINPDIIFVYLGINDYNFNRSDVGSGAVDYAKLVNSDGTYVTPTTFGEAYGILLCKMQKAYPNAQIFAMTLLPENLYSVNMTAWEQHNAYIRAAAEYYDIPLVDLAEKCAITWDNYSGYMMDKIHPTTAGMKLISDCIKTKLEAYYLQHEDDTHQHRYAAAVTAPTCTAQGYTTYTCDCGDSYVDDYKAATGEHCYENGICTGCGQKEPVTLRNYRWEIQNNTMVSVTANGNTANRPTLNGGSLNGGVMTKACFTLSHAVNLYHDVPWVIEWRSSGNWDGMLFASNADTSIEGTTYLFRFASMNFLALGEHTGVWHNYGLIHGIDMTEAHQFRVENRVAADGTNTVYLLVDGVEIDALNHYYQGGTDKKQIADWANNRDLVFNSIGTTSHPMKNMQLEYLQVWENGHEHAYQSDVTSPTCTDKGYTTYTCGCGGSYVGSYVDAKGHSYLNSSCTVCGAAASNPYAGKTIACIGDSITYGVGVTQGKTDYVTLLAKALEMNYIRLGASGTTLCTNGSRACNIDKLTESKLQGADVVTIAMGINDFCAAGKDYYKLGDINSTDSSTIYGAMRMWCERIAALRKTDSLKDTEFYFVTPLITSWNNSLTSARNWDQSKVNIHGYTLRDLCNAIIEVAALYDVAVIDLNLISGLYYVNAQDNNVDVFGGDGVHPGDAGHAMMAAALEDALLKHYLLDDHDHSYGSWLVTSYPDCESGEEKRVCQICRAAESRALAGKGHTLTQVVAKVPTCTEVGHKAYEYCSDCEYTTFQEVAAKGHSHKSVVTAPTCTEQGYTTYTCVCGDSYVSDYVAATGHKRTNGICSVCGDSFAGKKVSILSHSMSTYAGISNNTSYNSTIGKNDVYYTEGRHGVYLKDTWWMQTIDALDMELLVNNSWSGSCIFQPRKGESSVGYGDRAVNLHNDHTGEEPDIIFVYLGCNDFAYFKDTFGTADSVEYETIILDNGDGTYTYAQPTNACEAYAILLHKAEHRYPDAEIYCMTSTARREVDYTGDTYPDAGQPTAYVAELQKIAKYFGYPVIDLENAIPKNVEIFDKYIGDKRAHANVLGMDQITNEVLSVMLGKEAAICHVTAGHGVVAEQAVLLGGSYNAKVNIPQGYSVAVTMGGKDVTASAYKDGRIAIAEVTGDIHVETVINRDPQNFRWEFQNGILTSIGSSENVLTKLSGTITNNILNDGIFQLNTPVVLKHDLPWKVEWKCAEDWRGAMLVTHQESATKGVTFLTRTKGGQLCFGTYTGSQYDNYGIDISGLNADTHTYRLENRIAADNSNMIWLYVDGEEIGPMNNYFIGSKDQNKTSNWVNGKDFVFSFIGMAGHTLRNCQLDFLTVTECEHAYENGICTACGATQPGPVITQQPESVQQEIGKKFVITAKAEGDGLTYQWYVKESGANAFKVSSNKTSSYAYTMQSYMHNRSVYCVITDANSNSVQTEIATITRPPQALKILEQPKDAQQEIGQKFSIKPTVQGDGLTYQWYYKESYMKDFAVSSNKTSAYAYTMQSYMHNRSVYCVITDQYGNSVTTDAATITRPPVELKILTQPEDVYAAKGEKFSIRPEVQGDGLTYQWYYKERYHKNFSASSNKTAAYAYATQSYMNGRSVYCVITDQYGNQVTTENVTIYVTN